MLVVNLRITAPWGGEPLGLPILVMLHRKNDIKLSTWPYRPFKQSPDGFQNVPFVVVLMVHMPHHSSRWEQTELQSFEGSNAMLPSTTFRRNERLTNEDVHNKKGKRLNIPERFSKTANKWVRVETDERGKRRTRLVFTKVVLAISHKNLALHCSHDLL